MAQRWVEWRSRSTRCDRWHFASAVRDVQSGFLAVGVTSRPCGPKYPSSILSACNIVWSSPSDLSIFFIASKHFLQYFCRSESNMPGCIPSRWYFFLISSTHFQPSYIFNALYFCYRATQLCWGGLGSCNSVRLFIHLSHACFVTKPNNTLWIFW